MKSQIYVSCDVKMNFLIQKISMSRVIVGAADACILEDILK